VLFLVVCGTIANSDDDDDIVDWGEAHLEFLWRFSDAHHAIPCVDWLRTLLTLVDPDLFLACFRAWVAECWPQHFDLVAIDGSLLHTHTEPGPGALAIPPRLEAALAADVPSGSWIVAPS
jgi:hypothetical protein